ncbi:MAG: kinase-like domain-containing protein [Benjaminiella poitrasii]|nr:MAG: kinase-like domain-containing protein [Benjaminiella poitrasii]
MDIKTVGERVRLVAAIKALRQECYLAASLAARTTTPRVRMRKKRKRGKTRHHINRLIGFSKLSKSSEMSSAKSLLNRSNSFSRFLGRSDSKRSQRAQQQQQQSCTMQTQQVSDIYSQSPSSPRTIQKRNSLEGGIMSMEKVKQTCVKVFGEDGQTRIVNVHNTANEPKQIMAKVLHKFGIDESNADSYCIFVGSSTNGEARALSDTELVDICRSVDRPEKERLILRKRHMYPTYEEFKRKGTINGHHHQRHYHATHGSLRSVTTNNSSVRNSSIMNGNSGGRRRFFGERPPSEIISSNLPSFFPNHNREVLETAGIKAQRLSITRRNSALSRMEPRNYRNSVLPELVSVLGVDLDKFLEEEEDAASIATIVTEDAKEEEHDFKGANTVVTNTLERKSSLNHKSLRLKMKQQRQKDATTEEVAAVVPLAVSASTPITTMTPTSATRPKALPDTWMKGSLIGRGTFGDVYLGLNPINGELMAVKQVELPIENSVTALQKKMMIDALQREIKLLQELEHDNIVQYLGSKTDDSYFSIFLEYVPGGSVAGLLSSYGAFQEPLVKSFVRQILKGLNYLHHKDIVHRDIKGANVLVDNKGGVKITDFGISKKIEEGIILPPTTENGSKSTKSHRPSLQGSIYWMAPEVVKQTRYTRKADIWSLGCMIVEMFTGDHPFPEYSQMQAIFQIGCNTTPNIPSNISEDAQDFLRCTFQLNFEDRPSADELLKHLFLADPEEIEISSSIMSSN